MAKLENKIKGKRGEEAAKAYLLKLGYKVLEENWRYSKFAEVDIIAQDKDALVFVEVKYRSTLNFGHPYEAITRSKLEKIHLAALAYLQNSKYKKFRIDIIGVIGKEPFEIQHLQNVSLY